MVSGGVLAAILMLLTGEAPSMIWSPFRSEPAAGTSRPDSIVAVPTNPWVEYANATPEQRAVHAALLEHLLSSGLKPLDNVADLPPPYAAALKAEIGPEPIADGDDRMIGGCVGKAGDPFQRLMLCAFDENGGLLLVQHGGFASGAWLNLYDTSGAMLKKRAVYVFWTSSAGAGASLELQRELNAVVGDADKIFAVLRRYLPAAAEPSYLNGEE